MPDLDPSDPCTNLSTQYIPNNVTRKANLPDEQYEYPYIAFAPWISVPCTQSYLAAMTGANSFMTYIPDNGTDKPPLPNDQAWNLRDGGQWKKQNKFPVYALPGSEGTAIMQQLGQYSGNSSDPRIQGLLSQEQLDPTDYVRLFATFDIGGSNNLPNLWVFLLIVLGIALVVIGGLSFCMHWVQRRRRRDLQRRVENGEVDLEALGIKRNRVPQEVIDALPTSIYTQNIRSSNEKPPLSADGSSEPSDPPTSTPPISDHNKYSQPTCPICLDDFIPNTTTVRSLLCHHIYHPACIDPFLLSNSSLCPVCKARVIPAGSKYNNIGPITNAVVRWERRMRQSGQHRPPTALRTTEQGSRWTSQMRHVGRRVFSAPGRPANTRTTSQIEMGIVERRAISGPNTVAVSATEGESLPSDANLRREWMRRRIDSLRGPQRTVVEEEAERVAGMPRCKSCSTTLRRHLSLLDTRL